MAKRVVEEDAASFRIGVHKIPLNTPPPHEWHFPVLDGATGAWPRAGRVMQVPNLQKFMRAQRIDGVGSAAS